MSYAICNVVVGFMPTDELYDFIKDNLDDSEYLGIETPYNASGDSNFYCGIKIFQFDECSYLTVAKLIPHLTPTKDQLNKAETAIENFREKLLEFLKDDSEEWSEDEIQTLLDLIPEKPECILVWSSS